MQVEVPSSARTIITAGVAPNKRYQPPPPGLTPALYKTVLVTGATTTPTATVQPTLVSLPGTAKPVIGTVSPQNFSSSTFQAYPNMGSGASPGYQAGQVYPGNSVQYPGYPYSQQYGQQYQYQGKTDQYGGGYCIAGAPVPPYHGAALVPATPSSSASPNFPPSSATNSASPGFIYGPYSYGPYGAGRVIGPIIALGKCKELYLLTKYFKIFLIKKLKLIIHNSFLL